MRRFSVCNGHNRVASPLYRYDAGGTVLEVPQQISGLYAWYRGDTVTLSGSSVTQWDDKSGNGHHLTQGVGDRQPTYAANSVRFNNQPELSFDGGDQLIAATAGDWTFLNNGAGGTVVVVWYTNTKGDNMPLVATNSDVTTNVGMKLMAKLLDVDRKLNFRVYDGAGGTNYCINFGSSVGVALTATTNITFAQYKEGDSPTEYLVQHNTASAGSGNSSRAPSASNPVGALTVGSDPLFSAKYTGYIAEVAIYNARISAADITAFEGYSRARYATT